MNTNAMNQLSFSVPITKALCHNVPWILLVEIKSGLFQSSFIGIKR